MQDDPEVLSEMTMEDRLKSIAYQFVKLYERWSEDRQEAAKQRADLEELIEALGEYIQNFKELEPKARQQWAASMQKALADTAEHVGTLLSKEAVRVVEETSQHLDRVVHRATETLSSYQEEVVKTQWKVIGVSALTTIATSLLVVWLLIPKPTLPLSNQQISYLNRVLMFEQIWPKLSKFDKEHWLKLIQEQDFTK